MSKSFGAFIRKRRRELGLTQRQVVESLGFKSVAFLSDIEANNRKLSRELLPMLAQILKTDIEILESHDVRVPLADVRSLLESHPEYSPAFRRVVAHSRDLGADEILRRIERRNVSSPERSGCVAITIDQDICDPQTSPVYLQIAQEVRGLLAEAGMTSRLYIGQNPPAEAHPDFHCPEFFQDVEEGKIRGVIGVLAHGQSDWIDALEKKGIIATGFGESFTYNVSEDVEQFFVSAVEELVQRGRRRIGLLAWGGFDLWRSRQAEMFRKVLEEAGLPVIEPWIKDDIYPSLDGSGWSMFREIWSARRERPDGLVVVDDFFLDGVAFAVGDMGIQIPEQVEIVANLSGKPVGRYPFPITAWQTDVPAIARALVDSEIRILRGETPIPPMTKILSRRITKPDYPRILVKN